jgi:hypothetical protein
MDTSTVYTLYHIDSDGPDLGRIANGRYELIAISIKILENKIG